MSLMVFLRRLAVAGVLLLTGSLVIQPPILRARQHLRLVHDAQMTLKCSRSTTDTPRVKLRITRPAPVLGWIAPRVHATALNTVDTSVAAAELPRRDRIRIDPDPLRAPPSDLFV